jgi:hypothetical protein
VASRIVPNSLCERTPDPHILKTPYKNPRKILEIWPGNDASDQEVRDARIRL